MDLWNKMKSSITTSFSKNDLEEDALLEQMNLALKEESVIWPQDSFVDPSVINDFRERWSSAYYTAKKHTSKLSFSLGFTGRKIRNLLPRFFDIYESIQKKLEVHNERIACERVKYASQLILPVEGRLLDDQQLRCLVKEAKNHLVLAGAGTGKTTTIVGYVKYLLKSGRCKPEDILVLSFTNASATEMSERLAAEIGYPMNASTFHKLGLNIIAEVQGKQPKIYSKDVRYFVRKQLDVLIQNTEYLRKLIRYLTYNGSQQQSEFDFNTKEEYQAYLKYNPPMTLNKEKVKSYGEMDIANFLTQNGVSYIYEKEYPVDTRTSEYGQYYPDFYLPNFDVYIEYFGVDRDGNVPAYFTRKNGKTPSETYQEGIRWKRELHRKQGTILVEVYAYEKFEEQLLDVLAERLKRAGVVLNPRTLQDIWNEMAGTENQKLDRVAELFGTIISLVKSNDCSLEDVRSRNKQHRNLPSVNAVLELVAPVYNNYQRLLSQNGEIDFSDMINLASKYVLDGKYHHSYQYVIVDEYQDISQARYRLLYSMRQDKEYNLFCVGDDWQSIYRFSGSDIGFILNFEKYWGSSEVSRIETTYRFPQSLIEVSGAFVVQNPAQKRKQLQSAIQDRGFSMERIVGYSDALTTELIRERLNDLPQNSTVLFLGRYRFDIKMFDANQQITYYHNQATGKVVVTYARRKDLKMEYMTVHGSKGLQADYVFVLNNRAHGMGFPSQITDAPVLQLLLDNCDTYPFAEERRLFYVAITRAKKKVWLVAPKNDESVFVKEIEMNYGNEMRREQYTCPQCGGKLVRRKGQYGEFYGCSNYRTNGCKYIRNITKRS